MEYQFVKLFIRSIKESTNIEISHIFIVWLFASNDFFEIVLSLNRSVFKEQNKLIYIT